MKRLFKIHSLEIPEYLQDSCREEQNVYNFRQIRSLAIFLILISFVYIGQLELFPLVDMDDSFFRTYIVLFSSIIGICLIYLLPFAFIVKIKSESVKKYFLLSFLFLIAAGMILLTYLDLHFSSDLSAFIIVLMYSCSILWFFPRDYALLSGGYLLLMIISLLVLNEGESCDVSIVVQVFVFYGLSWILYLSLYQMRNENFLNRIHREEQYRMLETESATDPLTGLYNRRHMKEELSKELARSERTESPFCIAALDVDHFKNVNDRYGHVTGDEVLCEMAVILRNSIRLSDKVFRFNGEKFVILLPETTSSAACILGERIRSTIESFTFSGVRKPITVSMGISQSQKGLSMDLLMTKADKRLLLAKTSGRNRVICD
jgi:diguanylate cyclase (GGDEF)-like protein